MKKSKITLNDLKVTSFVTTIGASNLKHLKGGVPETHTCPMVTILEDLNCGPLHTLPLVAC